MEETKTLQEEYSPTDAKREKVRRVAVAMIDDFPEHPFKVKDDEEMEKLKDSISLYGVLTPVVARRCENGRYELISGHRRRLRKSLLRHWRITMPESGRDGQTGMQDERYGIICSRGKAVSAF